MQMAVRDWRSHFLSWLFFQRYEIPKLSGYSPKHHRSCTDLMIPKKDPIKQRLLGILETEFNHLNREIGKGGMDLALAHGAIAAEQFSRPGQSAIDQSTLKRLSMDNQMYRRECYAQCSVDLSSNYDRIIHTAAAFALLRIGVPHAKIKSMFESIKKIYASIFTGNVRKNCEIEK